MKIRLVLALIISMVAFAGLVSAQEAKGPRIEVKEIQYDFGKVLQGAQATHVFEIRNAGNEPLVIERVVPSCGCTAVAISSNHLDPGAVGQIKASVDTTGRSGPLVKHVTVYSNDRTKPLVTMDVIMNIVQKEKF